MNLGDKLPIKAFENATFFEDNELLNEIRKKPTKTNTPTVNINIQSIQPVAPPAPVIQPVPVPVVQPVVPVVQPVVPLVQPVVQPVVPVVQPVVQVVQPVVPVVQPVVQPIAIEQQPPPLHTVTRPTSEPPCCPFSCCCF